MKRIILSILAVAALASCSKTESAYVDQDQEIKLNPVTSMATKAHGDCITGAIDGTAYPEEENFKVTAYYNNPQTNTENKVYLDDVEFTRKGLYWGGTTTYYWPKNGTLSFACYSPESVSGVEHDVDNDKYTVDYIQASATDKTIDFLLAPTTVPYTAETATENVSVVFEHALSWITIKVKAKSPQVAGAFTIHDVVVNQAYTAGTLAAEMKDGIQYNEWSAQATPADYKVVKGKKINLTTVATTVEDNEKGTVVIPQVPTTLTINYTQNKMEGTPELTGQTVTVPLELDNEANNIWEPGKHYIYTVIFDLDEILINPSVADWEDVVVDDKEAGDEGQIATVATLAELEEALAAEVPEIELTSTIDLTSELAVNYSVAFVGGGFTGKPITVTGPVVSFENVAFANATGDKETSVYVRNGNTNVTFQNCTFDSYKWEAIQYTSETGLWVCVDNCTFNAEAHRDLHLEVAKENGGSKAEVKITNNTFNGDDEDSYVTVYGFDQERMILEGNTTENPANTTNVWISDLFDYNTLTLRGFVEPTTEAPAAALTQSTILGGDYSVDALDLAGYDLDGAGHTLTMNLTANQNFLVVKGGVISNLNVLGYGARNTNSKVIYGIKLQNLTQDVVLNNVTSKGFAYALNTGSNTAAYNLTVQNSTLEGWTSYAIKSAKFISTNFTIGSYFSNKEASEVNVWNGTVKPYNATVFENCTFDKGFNLILGRLADGETVTFKDCTVDGVELTAENFTTYMKLDEYKLDSSDEYVVDSEGNKTSLWSSVKFE